MAQNNSRFWKDFRTYMKLYGTEAIEWYEKGFVTLNEALRMADEKRKKEFDDVVAHFTKPLKIRQEQN